MTSTPEPTSPATQSGKRSAKLGVAAGLLAGGAIGLVATVPSLTSAATDESIVDDGVGALQEAPDDGEATEAPDTDDARPEHGVRLRERLQPLVDDGTIDGGQADAVTEHLVENRPEREGRRHRGARGQVVADVLGIDDATLRAELEAGKSIADVAEANGVDVQTVVDELIADAERHIEVAAERGLDEERAAERLERMTERIEEHVYGTRDG